MLRIRLFEEKIVELYPAQEMMTPVHLYIGQEAVAAGVISNLKKKDYIFSNHRSHGHCIAKGSDFKGIMAELYGKKTGCSKGKGGSMHLVDVERGILGTTAIVGAGIPMAVGTALASQMKGDGLVTVAFFGDGAADEGVFHESLNFASLKKLPVVFVCENNFYATNSPLKARHSTCHIAGSSPAYNMPGVCVDGNDPVRVYKEAEGAVKRARRGDGPTLIEANTYRWKGHVGPETDFEKGSRPKKELLEWMERCPIKSFEELLKKGSVMSEEDMAREKRDIERELDEAVDFAKKSPWPKTE
jgi:pyruvate dehydrogenase E1 component alpha subunit